MWQTTFNLVTPVEFDGRQLRLAVPNLLVKERFEGRFRSLVTDALETAGWPDVEVSVQVSAASAAIDNVVDLAPVGAWTGPRQLTFDQASEPRRWWDDVDREQSFWSACQQGDRRDAVAHAELDDERASVSEVTQRRQVSLHVARPIEFDLIDVIDDHNRALALSTMPA